VTDLGYLLSMMFVDDSLTGIWTPSVEDGSPTAEEITQTYASLTGRDTSDVPYYAAFAVWKLACIREGVYTRLKQGRMGDLDVDPEQAGTSVEALAASALDILSSGRI
jgi:aminoglycoside phosphotransferase (APT) family kinase protein